VRSRRIQAALVCSFVLGLTPLAAQVTLQRGVDAFTTAADGRTYYDFIKNPLPAGFFCEGSKAFTGRVALKGLPLATESPLQLGNADTVIERLDDAALDAKGTAATRLRFRALSLVSIHPIKTACGDFHLYVSLDGQQRVTKMSIRRTEEGGGTFTAPLAVNARMRFVPVTPGPKAARTLELAGSFTFPPASEPWSFAQGAMNKRSGAVLVDTDGDQAPDTLLPSTSNFIAGRSPRTVDKFDGAECPCDTGEVTCHLYQGKEHCAAPAPPPGCARQFCTGL
jgi:hypothetical protein